MRLKALTLNGFKSFADKTKIEFQPGITGIVGPNGSGKSNIIEGLRWVLGEQSAKSLRGGKMPDVIFAGSDTRAKLNRAEVEIELDNSDYFLKKQPAQIVITRRIFRNGESEFLINGKTVRLRDIVDLFLDTGLGKESFSIISQGRVESIFNSKPQDRRSLIEEVAGVLKYKKEKSRAQKELEETTSHLNRVADIITELYQQRQPLEEQASIAHDYLEQKKQYDHFDLNNLVLEIKSKSAEKEKIQIELQKIKQIVEKHEHNARKQKDLTETLHEQQQQLEEQIDSAQKRLVELTQQKGYLSGEQKVSKQTHEYQDMQRNDAKQRISEDQQSLADANQDKKQILQQIAEIEAKKAELEEQISQLRLEGQTDAKTLSAQIEKLQQDIFNDIKAKDAFENEQKYLEKEYLNQVAVQQNTNTKLNDAKAEFLNNEKQIKEAEKNLARLNSQLTDLQQKQTVANEDVVKCTRRLDNQKERWYQASDILKKAETQYDTLKNVAANYSGYYQGVKKVLQAKSKLSGIVGAVAELFKVAPEYSKAIETTLGGQLQNVVVTTDSAAKEAIRYLSKNHYGRATFLPRNTVRKRSLNTNQLQILKETAGVIDVASNLVQVNANDQPILQHLLGTTVVVENLDNATVVATRLNHAVKIVTLNGDIINAGGSMTGGSTQQKHTGLLEQKQQTDSLAQNIVTMRKKMETVELEGAQNRKQLEKSQQYLEELKIQITKLEEAKQPVQKKYDVLKIEIEHQKREVDMHIHAQEDAKKNESNYQLQKDELAVKISDLAHKLDKQKQQLESKKAYFNNAEHMQQKNEHALNEAIQSKAVIDERLQSQKLQLKEITNQIERLEQNISKTQNRLNNLLSEQQQHSGRTEDLEAKKKAVDKEHTMLNVKVQEMISQRKQLHKEVTIAEKELTRVNELQKAAYDEQNEKTRYDSHLETLLENYLNSLSERHELTYEKALEKEDLETDLENVKRRLKLLKLGLDDLGEVNLGAISEFERVNERYEFLTKQQDDLLEAKDQLTNSMDEMDEEVKLRFKQTFTKVSEAFTAIFPAIFGGGRAQLSLTEPDDLLTTGIEIMAQPPGKKFQALTLLSGGEKALTAIALLFAILKVRPVPFVVLDEAEAALDDANVVRYSQYLQNFDMETQFIVITHRKGTMMNANTLYGVTMQESGISKMVSVSLEEVM